MKPENSKENSRKCICGECPVYSECCREKNELLFCGRTNSICELNQNRMCICGDCPIHFEYNLQGGYYCVNEFKG
ncbi:MAG: DUF2769 domain-containing protein [Candidatus Paceibacterota bacterium]|jgi:hypothetical protein|nr:DUF2769 domain-containing protein [Candidatus Paceibacterota bacterium]MDD4830551.1 DUF2769 domain-containing protein [Candidatus Paceibacterota bacterium]MDD4874780.1 DUF2769 domain-containing protein [Candidatus Paceibacterota bacterium]